ncbi:spore coat protein [Pseudidiomarina salinarum]|uniref:Spore coat protein n=1 Tax=Pseudidiomarina salinarum TaxID=435908 RepID=A0A094IUM1_9GAMM|nr:UDP-4-amino-4,6-dideoxy-N-acetyl-beta-L-altrosamine transaminase [Pseudidiomarina salinarum]KFZ31355.1 spore coat protein [Pseudidiomarina salinarum]RUO70887.1 UDP-4-amino-4,6-dideoxy-N-acetyl-beta-L-altrosamine transaminase [Pseudidiomarina salinarum]
MIPYGKQDIQQSDIDAVIEVLRSDFLTQGPKVPAFEMAVAQKVGAKYALAVNSATSALHIACLALGLGKGDWLWTTPVTFVASANCGLYCGSQVDFVDIDAKTYNISVSALENKLKRSASENRLPKVLVVVHLCGQPCEMQEIKLLADKYGVKVIEDASHAIGGKYQNDYIGNCKYSDITIFSFHPVKIITTAEGGMVLTNSDELADKMNLLRSHGITRDPHLMTIAPDGPWYYQQIDLGFNYRMTELQAALGLSQLDRLDEYVALRHTIATHYDSLLSALPLTLPSQHPDSYSGLHLYVIRLNLSQISVSHREVFESLRAQDIGVNLHYIPVHVQPYYQQFGFETEDFPEAMAYYREAITLPMYPSLTTVEQEHVVTALEKALRV